MEKQIPTSDIDFFSCFLDENNILDEFITHLAMKGLNIYIIEENEPQIEFKKFLQEKDLWNAFLLYCTADIEHENYTN